MQNQSYSNKDKMKILGHLLKFDPIIKRVKLIDCKIKNMADKYFCCFLKIII